MRRREFIAGLGGVAAWPVVARAQQPAMPLVGFLHLGPPDENNVAAFHRGLADAGFIEGKSVKIEYRWGYNQFSRLPDLAAELVGLQPRVILAAGARGPALAAKRATSTIPIVFLFAGDPVKSGLVASLGRPGGNITGMALISTELAGKRLDLLHKLVPQANTVAFLAGTPNLPSYQEQTSLMLEAGQALGLQIVIVECRDERDFEQAFATMIERRVGALILGTFPLGNLNKVVALAARHSIPAMYTGRSLVVNGGLVSYGPEFTTTYSDLATQYVARILKGAKAADLPVQQPTKYELIINLVTAKALGLTIPEALLATADEVIQ
jgi:putative tryptophan/tyrosine transport system substrate-binding protein